MSERNLKTTITLLVNARQQSCGKVDLIFSVVCVCVSICVFTGEGVHVQNFDPTSSL